VRRGAIVRVITIALLAAAAATAVAIFIDWLPAADSKEADRIDLVFWVVVAICIGVFAVVAAITIYSVVKFRVRPDDDSDGPPVHGHTGIEIVWTAIPTVLVVVIAVMSAVALAENGKLQSNRLEVDVTAQQFEWTFKYPNGVVTHELVLEKGRPTEFAITSLLHDVIHSFYVPQFRVKADAVPGIMNYTYATPTKVGKYVLICTELCGPGHSLMRAPVEVMEPADFTQWLATQKSEQSKGGA